MARLMDSSFERDSPFFLCFSIDEAGKLCFYVRFKDIVCIMTILLGKRKAIALFFLLKGTILLLTGRIRYSLEYNPEDKKSPCHLLLKLSMLLQRQFRHFMLYRKGSQHN